MIKARFFHVDAVGPMSGCSAERLVREMHSFEIQRVVYTAYIVVRAVVFVTSNDKAPAKQWRFHRDPRTVECWRKNVRLKHGHDQCLSVLAVAFE